MDVLRVTMFGKVGINRGHTSLSNLRAKVQELLCYLLLYRSQPQTREALACLLWKDASGEQGRKYLRQCLWQLQQALEPLGASQPPLLALDQEWVVICPDAVLWVDVEQLERAFLLARDVDGAALPPALAQAAQEAVALYEGELLTGWYQDWCLIARERYQSMFFALLDKLIDYCSAQGCFDQGIAYGMRLLREDYTRERTHRALMRLRYLAGDRTGALRQFELCASALQKEFGVRPSERTLRLREQIGADQLDAPLTAPGLLDGALAELARLSTFVAALQGDVEQLKQALRAS